MATGDEAGNRRERPQILHPSTSCRFRTSRTEDGSVLSVAGEVDIANVEELQRYLDLLAAEAPVTLVVEARDLEFLDLRGVAALIGTGRTVGAFGGTLVLRAPRPLIRRLFDLVGSDSVLIEG